MLQRFGIILLCLFLLGACGVTKPKGHLTKVGLLVPETINDQVWGTRGFEGLLRIQSKLEVDVFYKEGMNSEYVVERAVKEFDQKGVNLIFGHGSEYAEYFNHLSSKYPDIHFVSFNGEAKNPNTTSLNFKSYAMGFFGGMVAAHMSKKNKVGVLAAYEWQPEIEGFYQGALAEKNDVQVSIEYVEHWDNDMKAIQIADKMMDQGVDVIYPAGDGYNVPVIERVKERGLYVIGYVSDQSDLGESTVLTSTIQNVGKLYEIIAEQFNKGELKSGNLSFDFQDDVITLGKFSPLVKKDFVQKMKRHIQTYKETGKLPE
ncbi:BMP family ABC transporter substrate-binding protein [Neobacillus thermocopriae]|uniref:BMP family ABC transporter substrate-binding protein n=1 Tax=Neobacillus thermocopriae TaxID=1215031 RepID=A0A6B3TPE6_9BACI|nr:BMP family ABC transporter substrate-binding protein [Neobacillus thermocopriae]MED3623105.1 BMP family ABC transporter substrate-binding protein [Neobacillus thermocopriae]MED3715000.1 BMP family ABC transporter substrate-binding protein [Neobacillus thermocopriae]NEX78854.1 BMP family ABC transporter substrate-binding protein [Neobacillus thermocopriae]